MGDAKLSVKLPGAAKGKAISVGVDEAGRGPVLGPMVYACCFWEPGAQVEYAFDDSKKLSETQREQLFERIKADEHIGYVVAEISARMLSEKMLQTPEPVSLNKIAQDATFRMLDKVVELGFNLAEIFVDALGNCEIYEEVLRRRYPSASVVVKPKADALFKVVSAASICAKVSRDQLLRDWKFKEGIDFSNEWGCGYPGDEDTKRWLRNSVDKVFGFPDLVRFSWQTTKNLLEHDDSLDVVKVRYPEAEGRGSVSLQGMFKRARSSRGPWVANRGISSADLCQLGH